MCHVVYMLFNCSCVDCGCICVERSTLTTFGNANAFSFSRSVVWRKDTTKGRVVKALGDEGELPAVRRGNAGGNSTKLSYLTYLVYQICITHGRKVIVFCD